MSDEPEVPAGMDAYALLSKPIAEISDAEAELIVADLRRRRAAYIKTGKPDKPKAEKKAAVKLDADEKKRNTAALLAMLTVPGLEPKK